MKKKNLILILVSAVISLLPMTVSASKATCTYDYQKIGVKVIYTYEYGKPITYSPKEGNKYIGSNPLSNNDFVNKETGEISCPNLKLTSTTPSKGKWKISIKKDEAGTAGTLNMLVKDDKEINSPSSNQYQCNYTADGTGKKTYSLQWDPETNKVKYDLSDVLKGYTVVIKNCGEHNFDEGCPRVYDQIVAKGKKLLLDCENSILTNSDPVNTPDSSTDVDTGATNNNPEIDKDSATNKKPGSGFADEIRNQYIGNTTCGGLTIFTFHKRVPKLTSTLYNLLKVAIPVLLVIKGMIDMFKAMSAGKEDEMKKSQKKFVNRLIAAICAFIVFVLVETVIGWISIRTNNENAMDCVNCFINNKCDNN